MIPRKIHYCWFGHSPMPELALKCIESWHRYMPDFEFKLWNEDIFDVSVSPYAQEAYDCGKYAFVSDVVRLYALKKEGGIYLDVDFEVFKPFDDLLVYHAFAGFEGSKHNPIMMGVIGSEPDGEWVNEQISYYDGRHFIVGGRMDLTTNVTFISNRMQKNGFVPDGKEQNYKDLHVFPVEYFSPLLTSGEYRRTAKTYCEHRGIHSSWKKSSFKAHVLRFFPPRLRTSLILLKRKLFN